MLVSPASAAAVKKKASAGEKKKAASTAAKESKKQPSNVWTKAHPKFTYGQPILTDAKLLVAGSSTVALHTYYMKGCLGNKKNGILVKYRRQYFWSDRDIEFFLVGFDDLYDLFKLDALDVSLLRCFTLSLLQETKSKAMPVGFLDPELMSLSNITSDKSYVADYLGRALNHYAKKEIIMFPHNPGGHWILVVIIPKWSKVLCFDSLRSKAHDHTLLKEVIDEAFHSYPVRGMGSKSLTRVSKFPCHQ